mgnify:CR=1 FL=1
MKARHASFEQVMRADLREKRSEFAGYAAVAEIDGERHLLVLNATPVSKAMVSSKLAAIDGLKQGKRLAQNAGALKSYLQDNPEVERERGEAVAGFFHRWQSPRS